VFSTFYPELKDAGRWLFLIGSDVSEGRAARTTTAQIADRKKNSYGPRADCFC
jgi:hypothetical protein